MTHLNHSKEWNKLVSLDIELSQCKREFLSLDNDKQLTDLQTALNGSPTEILFALSFMEDLGPRYPQLLRRLIEIAIDGGEMQSANANKILSYYKDLLRSFLPDIVTPFLEKTAADDFHYSNIKRLLDQLMFNDLLKRYMEKYYATSNDPNILDMYQSFKSEQTE